MTVQRNTPFLLTYCTTICPSISNLLSLIDLRRTFQRKIQPLNFVSLCGGINSESSADLNLFLSIKENHLTPRFTLISLTSFGVNEKTESPHFYGTT